MRWPRHYGLVRAPIQTEVRVWYTGQSAKMPVERHRSNAHEDDVFPICFRVVRPRFMDSMRKISINAIQNQTVHMSCEAIGDPPPRVTWFKRDVEVFPLGTFSASGILGAGERANVMPMQGDQILQLTNVQKDDSGDYTCIVSNGGEAIEKKFNLTVISEYP